VAVIGLGFLLHGLLYYPAVAWLLGGKSPRVYLGGAREALVTGIATNSSLATVPVTLRCLTERLRVSESSARLSACMATNLNNDGIALYEAMAVLAIAQACGYELGLAQQFAVVLASVLAGIGIAGIPEAGIVMLPVVLASVGLPEAAAAAAVPLVMPVDWLLARARTALNVLSDMVVAIALDGRGAPAAAPRTRFPPPGRPRR
jgi:Na+/H+-dicarboxylate symporter